MGAEKRVYSPPYQIVGGLLWFLMLNYTVKFQILLIIHSSAQPTAVAKATASLAPWDEGLLLLY